MLPVAIAILAASIISAPLLARQQPAVTADDYARAERFLAPAVTPLVSGGSVAAAWLPDDRFWYRNALPTGAEFILVDPVRKTRTRCRNQNHGYGTASAYMMRRRWDYFVKWLQGVEPPKEYQMT